LKALKHIKNIKEKHLNTFKLGFNSTCNQKVVGNLSFGDSGLVPVTPVFFIKHFQYAGTTISKLLFKNLSI